jgi:hypothetical protein
VCDSVGIDPGPRSRESLEHRYWVKRAAQHFEKAGYEVTREHLIAGNGAIDLLAERPGERLAVEVETGKSDIKTNLAKVTGAGFDRLIVIATSPEAVTACRKASHGVHGPPEPEMLTWLDIS